MSSTDTSGQPSGSAAVIASIVRTLLGIAGGWLIGKGYFTAEQMPQVIGGATAFVVAVWSIYQKLSAHKALAAAISAPAGRAK